MLDFVSEERLAVPPREAHDRSAPGQAAEVDQTLDGDVAWIAVHVNSVFEIEEHVHPAEKDNRAPSDEHPEKRLRAPALQ